MKNNIIINLMFLCVFSGMYSCGQNKEDYVTTENGANPDNSKVNNLMNNISEILEKQLKSGGYAANEVTDVAHYKFNESDLLVTIPIIKQILNNNGYRLRDKQSFEQRVYEIFGKRKLYGSIYYISALNLCFQPDKINYYDPDGFRSDNYIDMDSQLITSLFYLPELIDYKKEFPASAKIEDNMPVEIESEFGKLFITPWKEITDLEQQRKSNEQLLVNRNLYLFNDEKSKLPWLLKNDEYFMKSLLLTFGWEGDDKLIKWVIKETPLKYNREENNAEEFGKLLYNKDCSGNLKINKRVLELMAEENVDNHRRYLMDYIHHYLASNLYNDDINLSFPEIAKITAYALDFIINNLEKEQDIYNYQGLFAEKSDYENRYDKEFRKNNFYGIPGFKEKWEEAKIEGDGIALPGEE